MTEVVSGSGCRLEKGISNPYWVLEMLGYFELGGKQLHRYVYKKKKNHWIFMHFIHFTVGIFYVDF